MKKIRLESEDEGVPSTGKPAFGSTVLDRFPQTNHRGIYNSM